LAEALFEADPIAGPCANAPSDTELAALLARGGLPAYALAEPPLSPGQLSLAVRADTLGLLSETILPGENLNAITARSILDAMARRPGGIVNLSKTGAALHLDQRTVARYLGLLERLFLVWWLPNLATEPGRQSAARSKAHPVDTSISVESLGRAGAAPAESPQLLGPLIESHVANQVRAAATWAGEPPDLFYWRQPGNRPAEVDLVLRDAGGRLVGVEVKNTTRVGPDDLRGLRSLDRDRPIHRGFLVYRGAQTLQVDRSTWAVPLAAFARGDWFAC
jgi:predicted AAA+ superfamily ATPase